MNKKHLPPSDFMELQNRKAEIIIKKSANGTIPYNAIWIDNQEFMQLLRCSRKTSQNYRDRNLIGYSVIGANDCGKGGRVYFRLSDVLELLEKNYKSKDRPY